MVVDRVLFDGGSKLQRQQRLTEIRGDFVAVDRGGRTNLGIFAVVVGDVESGMGLGLVAGGWRGWWLCWLAKRWCWVVVVAMI